MKNVFIIIPWFDPAFRAGGPIQSLVNMVNSYDNNIKFSIFCSNKDHDDSILSTIKFNHWIGYNSSTLVWYSSASKHFSEFKKVTKNERVDVLFIIGLFSWSFNILPLLFSKANKKILSVRGMLHSGALSQKKIKKKLFLFLLRLTRIQKRVYFHATDEQEKIFIQNIFGKKSKIYVAGNFPKNANQFKNPTKQKNKLKLITVALISPMKNHLMVLEALEYCEADIEYNIIGSVKDKLYWDACLQAIEKLPSNIKVNVLGEIEPNKIPDYLLQSDVFIMPSKSENYGHAIVEALSTGLPVITSQNTPWNELQNDHAGINVETNAAAIKNAIDYFAAMDNVEYQKWSVASISYANKSTNLEQLHNQYAEMFS